MGSLWIFGKNGARGGSCYGHVQRRRADSPHPAVARQKVRSSWLRQSVGPTIVSTALCGSVDQCPARTGRRSGGCKVVRIDEGRFFDLNLPRLNTSPDGAAGHRVAGWDYLGRPFITFLIRQPKRTPSPKSAWSAAIPRITRSGSVGSGERGVVARVATHALPTLL